MRHRQSGFTMIELIMVIVILGILAAIAMPRLVDLSSDAKTSAMAGVTGAAASAMAINYASCSLVNQKATAGRCVLVDNCDDVGSLMQGGLPSGYVPTAAALSTASSNGDEATCTITKTDNGVVTTGTYTGIGAGNTP